MTTPSATTTAPKKTALYDRHVASGAKIIDFGGWAMPVQYSGILDEHKAVRTAAGMFDVSHMGEVLFKGPRAREAIQKLVTNDVYKLQDGQAMYTVACRPHGGIVDDLIVYRQAEDDFLIVVNAGNIAKDVAWFHEQADPICEVIDASDSLSLLAVQGPRAPPHPAPGAPDGARGGSKVSALTGRSSPGGSLSNAPAVADQA